MVWDGLASYSMLGIDEQVSQWAISNTRANVNGEEENAFSEIQMTPGNLT